jgi:hypothetical protein
MGASRLERQFFVFRSYAASLSGFGPFASEKLLTFCSELFFSLELPPADGWKTVDAPGRGT